MGSFICRLKNHLGRSPPIANTLNLFSRFKASSSRSNKPMAKGDKFITLERDYLDKFDEIVVIGDVHGCYDELKELLNKVHEESPSKDPDKSLKIFVGDLVNKGPKNKEVLGLCSDKYPKSILSVRGNHDEIVLDQYNLFKSGKELEARNKWIESLPSRYISYLEYLPYTISIPSLKSIIVHAGLEPFIDEPAKNTPTNLMTTMRNIVIEKDPTSNNNHHRCTKKIDEGAPWAIFWPGPEHVYFGHDARRRLQDKHEFATGLDTGCVYGDRLSYIYIKGSRKGEISNIKAHKVYEPTSDTEDWNKKSKDVFKE